MSNLVSDKRIESKIYLIRGKKVMLDRDLANLYGVKTKALNQAVKRNLNRFPEDFMFQLTMQEASRFINPSRSQSVTLKRGLNIKYLPYVFTEQGVAMLSSVLKSEKAIEVNIVIMRVFVKIKELLSTHKELAQNLDKLEQKVQKHDVEIHAIFDAIRKLILPEEKPRHKIGFITNKK